MAIAAPSIQISHQISFLSILSLPAVQKSWGQYTLDMCSVNSASYPPAPPHTSCESLSTNITLLPTEANFWLLNFSHNQSSVGWALELYFSGKRNINWIQTTTYLKMIYRWLVDDNVMIALQGKLRSSGCIFMTIEGNYKEYNNVSIAWSSQDSPD